ncbi:MAG: hypothetical protein ACI4OL_00695 [Gemmiger sp.]
MIELLGVLAALGALFLLCAFFTLKCRIHSALAPLTALGIVASWLTVCGVADMLLAGAWVLYAACLALGVWALVPARGEKPDVRALFSPGSVLFWGGCLAFAVYFFIRQPMATDFDEMSFWATAAMLTKTDNRLYTSAVLGTPWPATQNPGLPLLSYFFQFFGTYADWKLYLACDALAFAVYAAVLGGVQWKQYRLAVPLAAACWCAPWFLTVYNHTVYLDHTYMTAYGDVPAGLALGGAVALWIFLRRTGGPKWAVLPVLALCANIKSNTFVLALVAAGLVAVDGWLFPDETPFRSGLLRRTGFSALCMAVPLAMSRLWSAHIAGVVRANAEAGGTGATSEDPMTVAVYGIRMLLGLDVPEFYESRRSQFYTAMADMGRQFWTSDGRMSMIGQGCMVAAFVLCLFFGAWLVGGQRKLRLRTAVTAALSVVCFAGYNLMLALSYGFIFKPFQAESLADYNRYIYSYYIGWFLIALAFVSLALQPGAETVREAGGDGPRLRRTAVRPRLALLGEGAVLLIAAAMLARTNQMVLPQLSVLGFSDSAFADRRHQQQCAAQVKEYLTEDDRIFYVYQGDNGLKWFSATYDFYPTVVDKSGDDTYNCGGTFGLPELWPAEEGDRNYYYRPFTVEGFDAAVRDSGCTVLYLDAVDDIFVQSYAGLFTDGLAAALSGETVLYRVTDEGFAPVAMEAPL